MALNPLGSQPNVNRPAKVSVVIPCFNHGEFLPEAVASVMATKRDDLEIIVVDDGSTDERTRQETDTLASQGIALIRKENGGPAAARNAAIAVAHGEYIFPLDADDHLRPDCLGREVEILDANPKVGVVYSDGEYFGIRSGRWNIGPFDPNRLLNWNYIAACALFRRCIWEQSGGYEEAKVVQGLEDWDFWLGALEHGWEFAYVPEVLFEYRVAKRSMITSTFGSEPQIEAFIGMKHGLLYEQAWRQMAREHESAKATFRNLRRLLKARFRREFQKKGMRD